jgi:hypothetical protein
MIEISNVEIYPDGGTIEFQLEGGDVDGFYRLQTPFLGTPEPLFRDGARLDFASNEEGAVLVALESWLRAIMTPVSAAALAELIALREWRNLPARLSDVVPIRYIQIVAEKLRERTSAQAAMAGLYLIVAPTMLAPEVIDSANCYRAMRVVLRIAASQEEVGQAVFCPGFGTGVGKVDAEVAAQEMANAYREWKISH